MEKRITTEKKSSDTNRTHTTKRAALCGAAASLLIACQEMPKESTFNYDERERLVGAVAQGSPLTPELLWSMGRIAAADIAPDGLKLIYAVTYTDMAQNKNFTDLHIMDVVNGNNERLTTTPENESEPRWHPDGRHVTYLADRKVKDRKTGTQLWMLDTQNPQAEPKQLTNVMGGIETYLLSPDGKKLLYVQKVKMDSDIKDIYPDLPLAEVKIETDLMYRHWNEWEDGKFNHPIVAPLNGTPITKGDDLLDGERYHSPLMPFGGSEELAWSPDGRYVAYTCKKLCGLQSARSTNSNIYLYDTQEKTTRCVSEDGGGYDRCPIFAPDGHYIYWLSMERDGYESDQNRIVRCDLRTDSVINLFADIELSAECFALSPNGKTIFFIADRMARRAIFSMDPVTRKTHQLTQDMADYTALVGFSDNSVLAMRQSMHQPTEVYAVDLGTGKSLQLTRVNNELLAKLDMGRIEERYVETVDHKRMHVWMLLPPGFDESNKYPALLYCQGGPQSSLSQFWSLRWNLALMAANGYVVVAPNRRGMPGFGKEWNEQISGDYGGLNMQDYLRAIDDAAAEPYIDANRLGAVGASYGGYSVYWLAGNHNKRFKAFIAHCGIYNLEMQYPTTEEMFFVDWDLKGAPWEAATNPSAARSYAASPHLFVKNWDTPIMVIHGEKDFRIPYTQGMAAFNTAVMQGLPARFLYFPGECHWVQKPQNSLLWHREFYKWLDKWLKD